MLYGNIYDDTTSKDAVTASVVLVVLGIERYPLQHLLLVLLSNIIADVK